MLVSGRHIDISHLKAKTKLGEEVIKQAGCRRCHIVGERGNRLSVNLDSSFRRKEISVLEKSVREPAIAMPEFNLQDNELDAVFTTILHSSSKTEIIADAPVVVHFSNKKGGVPDDIFSKKCGGCHRILSKRSGAVGNGRTAPDLSGILTKYYPSDRCWSSEKILKWVANPRKIKKWSRMPPVKLSQEESEILLELFDPSKRKTIH